MAWYNSSWQYRKKLTVNATKVSADLTDYPVYVNLADLGSNFFSNVKSDGSDIVITSSNGTTKLSRELVSIDTTAQTGELHFKATSLSSSTDTDFYCYYGYASASETNDTTTWDSSFMGVWHLEESGNGTVGEFKDSTSNANDGQGGGGTSSYVPTRVNSKIGKGQEFDGVDDYIKFGDLYISGNITVEAWIYTHAASTEQRPVAKRDTYVLDLYSDNKMYWEVYFSGGSSIQPSYSYSTNVWQHWVGTYDGSSAILYLNGSNVASASGSGTLNDSGYSLLFGNLELYSLFFDGVLDEVRISNTPRSADWISTTHNNQSSPSTFYTVGSQEVSNTAPDTPTNSSPSNGATGVSLTPTLQASAFSDPDGDGHAASQWQVTTTSGDYSSPVFDSGEDATNLTSITLSTALSSGTTYYWHVRYKDDNALPAWSDYSSETSFTTKDLRISGKVTKDGVGVQGAKLFLIDRATDTVVDTTTTDVNGDYYFSKLDSSKTYHVCVEYESGGQKYRAESHWSITPAEVDI